jgi:5-formyltetrahydrofolate cyclo-ligase
MTDLSTADAKSALRSDLRAARSARPADEDAAVRLSEQLGQYCLDNRIRVAAAYLPLPGEPDISGFLDWAREQSITLLLPNVTGQDLRWVEFNSETKLGELKFAEAAGKQSDLKRAEVVFLPALAVDLSGNRLGKGKGFYDRALAHLAAAKGRAKHVAVVFDEELVLQLPAESHDQKVDAAVTASKFVWFKR